MPLDREFWQEEPWGRKMIKIGQLKLAVEEGQEALLPAIAKCLKLKKEEISAYQILRRSLDARKKPQLFYVYTVSVELRGVSEKKVLAKVKNKDIQSYIPVLYQEPKCPEKIQGKALEDFFQWEEHRPIVVGFGPAGIFAALLLARAGCRPIIYERGKAVEERAKDVEALWEKGILNKESNPQFGEGGAGTFSDGKLNTLVKDQNGRSRFVLQEFIRHGAKEEILYDAKPHVGTDALISIVSSIRKEIESLGGEIHFEKQYHFLKEEKNPLIIAIGHSARDSFRELYDLSYPLLAKDFAMGFRVQHSQKDIDTALYGEISEELREKLGASAYKISHQAKHRSFYSFCMCPGGYVVNSSSEEGRLCVNGMSYSKRDSGYANSAIIFTIKKEEYGGEKNPLAGIALQEYWEEKAFHLGEGRVPYSRYDKIKNVANEIEDLELMLKGQSKECDLNPLFRFENYPKLGNIKEDFIESMEAFEGKMKGFAKGNTLVYGVESRTSSPLRILRDENFRCMEKDIYPCGEGAGYAGGIMSAAMDGMKVAEAYIRSLQNRG